MVIYSLPRCCDAQDHSTLSYLAGKPQLEDFPEQGQQTVDGAQVGETCQQTVAALQAKPALSQADSRLLIE